MSNVNNTFVDPRTRPDPKDTRPPFRITGEVDELSEFHDLCRKGRLYDIERWIQAGQPLQLRFEQPQDRPRGFHTALEIALDRRDHSLVLLLLANGYDIGAEPACPLDRALRLRRRDLLDLLLEWGADPHRVCLETLCDTYDSELYERFHNLGVDLTTDHALAHALGYHTSNKPLFGFAKRHRETNPKIQSQLNIALAHHADEGSEKGVLLSLWAGADPHAAVPYLSHLHIVDEDDEGSSAIHRACGSGHANILKHLGPDPAHDNFDRLYGWAPNKEVVEVLSRLAPPENPSRVVVRQLSRAAWGLREQRPVETLEALFLAGVRWHSSPQERIGEVRRELLKTDERTFARLMQVLGTDDYCSQPVLTELARTQSIRRRMRHVGLIPGKAGERSEFDRSRPKRARDVLVKFGLEPARPHRSKTTTTPQPRISATTSIGVPRRKSRLIRLDRSTLFERVWSTPVETLAKEWGLSGRGLAKACRRIQVPVPPRGYWAKVAAGKKVTRPKLPVQRSGSDEEVLIRVPLAENESEPSS